MSCCRALTKCKYRWPVGQLRSNFPRGINFTAPGASAAVLQHVIPSCRSRRRRHTRQPGRDRYHKPHRGFQHNRASHRRTGTFPHGHQYMAGRPGWGLNTIADTPDGPEGWNEDQRRPPSSPRETGCEDLPGGIRGAARAPPRMPCRVNGLYWADSKVKGKEEAQQHKCMATVFCPLRGGFGLLKASTGPRPDGIHDLYNQGQPGV